MRKIRRVRYVLITLLACMAFLAIPAIANAHYPDHDVSWGVAFWKMRDHCNGVGGCQDVKVLTCRIYGEHSRECYGRFKTYSWLFGTRCFQAWSYVGHDYIVWLYNQEQFNCRDY